jgi:hypothetical protein
MNNHEENDMKVKITMTGPGGELDSVTLESINDETDPRISETVADMGASATWAVGDTLTIAEVE